MNPPGTFRFRPERRLFANVAALGAIQVCRKTLPMLTLPYLARVLGSEAWGLVTFFQSFAACGIVAIEFGFSLSASRDVARNRGDKKKLAEVTAGVFGAQLGLAALVILSTLAAGLCIAPLRHHPLFTGAALVWSVAEGCSPFWYFLGLEEMGLIAALEISTKLVAAAGVFLLVHAAADAPRVIMLQAAASGLALGVGLLMIRRRHPLLTLARDSVRHAFKVGWPMFALRSAESLYTAGNGFLLGVLSTPYLVAYFAGPEKISRALFGLFNPLRDALYPRLSSLTPNSPRQAARLAWIGTVLTTAGGLLIGVAVYIFAPRLVLLAMGPGFAPAIPVLRILAVLPVVRAITQSASLQWLLPHGKEGTFIRVTLVAAAVHLVLVGIFARRYTYVGMAWIVLVSETLVCLLSVAAARKMVRSKPAPPPSAEEMVLAEVAVSPECGA